MELNSNPNVKQERQAAQKAFKRAIKRGHCTLKELIDQFYMIEEGYMLTDYRADIKTNYVFA